MLQPGLNLLCRVGMGQGLPSKKKGIGPESFEVKENIFDLTAPCTQNSD